ncbi:MAG: HAD family hydrolase [Candidatus Odinarchaeia archaeon]
MDKKNNKIKGVVFDLDGTLVAFKIEYMKAKKEVEEYLRSLGIPEHLFNKTPIFTGLIKILDFLKKKGVTDNELSLIKQRVNEIASKYEFDAANKTSLLPGVKEVLEYIKKRGLKIGLFTINQRKVVEYLLNKMNIKHYFDAVVTRDDVDEPKPSSKHLIAVLEKLNLKPEEVLVVGDHPIDFDAANKMGATTIGVETRMNGAELRRRGGVTHTIKNIREVLKFI